MMALGPSGELIRPTVGIREWERWWIFQWNFQNGKFKMYAHAKFNIEAENEKLSSEKESSLPTTIFQVICLDLGV